jgi:hypothetical protein
LAAVYNPKRRDKFKPVSQALETEASKNYKLKVYQGILGMVGGVQNPKTPLVINYLIGQMIEIMGGDFSHFKKFMFSEDETTNLLYILATGAKGMPSPAAPPQMAQPQNQLGMPQRPQEQQARGTM